MRVLILGGTVFAGRWIAVEALARGHDVAVFHRGRHGLGAVPQAETLIGDRDGDLRALDGREWDAVVDTSAWHPRQVTATAQVLAGRVGHVTLVSSIAAYRDWPHAPAGPGAPLHGAAEEAHGPLKASCERAAREAYGSRLLCLRPGALVGPADYGGRLQWWIRRMGDGGRVLAPGPSGAPVQLTDARDLAVLAVDAAEAELTGTVNAVPAPGTQTWGEVLQACRTAAGGTAELVWVDGERVAASVEDPWSELPLWPDPALAGLYAVEGMIDTRPLAQTAADTAAALDVDALADSYRPEQRATGLDPRRETVLLAALG